MPALVIAIAAGWVAIGLLLSVVMGRRGHDSFGWLVTGSLLGPVGVVLAMDARRRAERLEPARLRKGPPSIPSSGPIDVLVGFDGSPESRAAIEAVPSLLGDGITKAILGSSATQLAENSKVPVLLVTADRGSTGAT